MGSSEWQELDGDFGVGEVLANDTVLDKAGRVEGLE